MRSLVSLVVLLIVFPVLSFGAGEGVDTPSLTVYYLEFPPYYYTNSDGVPDGFLLKKTTEILRRVGFAPSYQSMPAKRILQSMRTETPLCSIGWFKTLKREKFAKFSRQIYKNEPLEILYLKKNDKAFIGVQTFAQLMENRSITLGLLDGYSLGSVVDHLIEKGNAQSDVVVGGYPQLVRMLAIERFSYIIVAPEEIDVLIEKNHLRRDLFACKKLVDIPAGNSRFLMFSRGVSKEIVIRVNRAIESME